MKIIRAPVYLCVCVLCFFYFLVDRMHSWLEENWIRFVHLLVADGTEYVIGNDAVHHSTLRCRWKNENLANQPCHLSIYFSDRKYLFWRNATACIKALLCISIMWNDRMRNSDAVPYSDSSLDLSLTVSSYHHEARKNIRKIKRITDANIYAFKCADTHTHTQALARAYSEHMERITDANAQLLFFFHYLYCYYSISTST